MEGGGEWWGLGRDDGAGGVVVHGRCWLKLL